MGKRLFDIVVGTVLSVICLPLIALLAVGVCFSLQTVSPFFTQYRIGARGRYFRIIKLRTLPADTFPYALRGAVRGLPLTPFARFLRRRHLDELPQLLLVPLGILSIVGPRPKMPDTFEPVDDSYGALRVRVAQGCTGLWQISVHRYQMPDACPEYDLFYLEHATLRLDFWVLWRTALLVLGLAGPVRLIDIPRWTTRREIRLRSAADTRLNDASSPTANGTGSVIFEPAGSLHSDAGERLAV